MPKIAPFDKYPDRYENWFYKNKYVYQSEINAIRDVLPDFKDGFEIGVGSGRFAEPLGIKFGIEPSHSMREIAESKGIKVADGVAEDLPYKNSSFDLALMITTICFLDDVRKAFFEVYRVLKVDGFFINGFVDKNSRVGKLYQRNKKENVFYKIADFFSVKEVINILKETGFKNFEFRQTIFRTLNRITRVEKVKEGYGKGSFVVIRVQK